MCQLDWRVIIEFCMLVACHPGSNPGGRQANQE
jgi:hypothetical protein